MPPRRTSRDGHAGASTLSPARAQPRRAGSSASGSREAPAGPIRETRRDRAEAGRLIALSARVLPPELRHEFVEDQCGNLASVESRGEWLGYLLGLLTRMPSIAAAASPGRSRW